MGLSVQHLCVQVHGSLVLQDLSFDIQPGEVHAIMGPNGAGKSTLAKVLAGHPEYEVVDGDILVQGTSIVAMSPEERSLSGVFVGYQHPVEVAGVHNGTFLRTIINCHRKYRGESPLSDSQARLLIAEAAQSIFDESFLNRDLHVGFSGGERKKNECLQMKLLDPSLIILDEPDSGVDVDGVKLIGEHIRSMASPMKSICMITHYPKIFRFVPPHVVHIMMKGRIVMSSDVELAHTIEQRGYDWLT